ncbi:MAG: sugar phosphate isomerase/epimerase [Clostridia bacterium]|nr:sugar phosphate isomerase/epimerase [Clostridia bacterium]
MYNFPIGVMLESFRLPLREAVEKAASLGVQGLQVYASRGEITPEMTKDKKAEFISLLDANGLKLSALCGDFGHGFGDKEKNKDLIEASKKVLYLAKELGTNIVTTHIGVVPEDPSHPRYQIMQEACFTLAEFADSQDAHFAIETGPEKASVLKGFLDGLHSKGVAVNLDPANLAMVVGDDAVEAVHTLKDYIVHTHAKDGKMLAQKKPEYIYGVEADPHPEIASFLEVPLGEGSVNFPTYLAALQEVGYRGFLTIEREVGENPAGDIGMAVDFLKGIIGGNE